MKKYLLLFAALSLISVAGISQKILFIHHSTGGGVYSQGNVATWMTNYNTTHGKNYQLTERGYPDSPYPWENYPYDYWNLWVNPATTCNSSNPKIECINTLTQNYNVIIFKHCFPGAGIGADEATSSVSSSAKTLGNYKLQYRALRTMMDNHPNNKFIVWTLTPLHRNATNDADAARAKQFVDWVKTQWLTEDGRSHPNIYIFDFWGIVAESNANPTQGKVNCLKYAYEGDHNGSDSHPNQAANQVAGPLFGQCIVNAIEGVHTAAQQLVSDTKTMVFPNPSNGRIKITSKNIPAEGSLFTITNRSGQKVFATIITQSTTDLDLTFLAEGLYFYSIQTAGNKETNKLMIVK